jgi:hypothetical protein
MLREDFPDDFPVDLVVGMDREVAESHGGNEITGNGFGDCTLIRENPEGFSHGFRHGKPTFACNPMEGDVHTNLNGPFQIDGDDILRVDIFPKAFKGFGCLGPESFNATVQTLQL